MQMLYCFVNNIHVDYADMLWEGFHYSLKYQKTLIPYPRFTKLIVSHYMNTFLEISRRARDKYHNLEDDEIVKSIFNSWKNKAKFGMKIPIWMITDEMKLTDNYRMTTSAPITPNPDVAEGESSASRMSTVIRLRIPQRQSTRLTPPTPNPTTDEADDIILQDTIQLSLVKLEPRSNKESPEVEITAAIQPVNVNEKEEESRDDDYEPKRREKGSIPFAIRPRDQNDPHDNAHHEGENNSFAIDYDKLPTKKVLQELVEEMSQTIDKEKLRKVVKEIKEILVSPYPQKPNPVVQSFQRDPKAPALSLVNQDLL
ncbi:hypothetical protein Tco_0303713 [Tanacetum coccineum]